MKPESVVSHRCIGRDREENKLRLIVQQQLSLRIADHPLLGVGCNQCCTEARSSLVILFPRANRLPASTRPKSSISFAIAPVHPV